MEVTWIAIVASLLMGGGGLLVFIWAVRNQQFKSFEDVKYQVFWSEFDGQMATHPAAAPQRTNEEQPDGSSNQDS